MAKYSYSIGDKFNRLTVLGEDKERVNKYPLRLVCRCDCKDKNIVSVTIYNLVRENTKSCGCLARELTIERSTTHGRRHTPEWHIWAQFIGRCTNPKNKGYKNYGGRGIIIEDLRWFHFQYFLDDVGLRPSPELSLDRLDNDRGYCKENTAWRTRKDQSRNRRNRIWLEYRGERRILSDWCETLNLPYHVMRRRIVDRGLSAKEAFETPIRQRSDRNSSVRMEEGSPLNDRKQPMPLTDKKEF